MTQWHLGALLLSLAALSGCGTYASGSVTPAAGTAATAAAAPRDPASIRVTENDITDRRYESLGDISVAVRKTTIFDSDPTRERVDEALKREAARIGADAVVLVRYGTVGIDAFSWGRLDGNGRAIRFVP
jgi:uncharacterized protein YbjQ (UPF0145 family)